MRLKEAGSKDDRRIRIEDDAEMKKRRKSRMQRCLSAICLNTRCLMVVVLVVMCTFSLLTLYEVLYPVSEFDINEFHMLRNGTPRVPLIMNWRNCTIHTEIGLKIKEIQNDCDRPYQTYYMHNVGLGAEFHDWAQGLCYSIEMGTSLKTIKADSGVTSAEWAIVLGSWAYSDASLCSQAEFDEPLSCYFKDLQPCGSIATRLNSDKPIDVNSPPMNTESVNCQMNAASKQEYNAGAMEFLFHRLSDKIITLAEEMAYDVFGPTGAPHDLISVHIRWGDKAVEMTLQPIESYIKAVQDMIDKHHIATPKIYLATSDPAAWRAFVDRAPKTWIVYVDSYVKKHSIGLPSLIQQYNSIGVYLSRLSKGKAGSSSLTSLLLTMEARYYIFTGGSNWSRVIDELRRAIVDYQCNGCTDFIDIYHGG